MNWMKRWFVSTLPSRRSPLLLGVLDFTASHRRVPFTRPAAPRPR